MASKTVIKTYNNDKGGIDIDVKIGKNIYGVSTSDWGVSMAIDQLCEMILRRECDLSRNDVIASITERMCEGA